MVSCFIFVMAKCIGFKMCLRLLLLPLLLLLLLLLLTRASGVVDLASIY